jgi:hypothetical protein
MQTQTQNPQNPVLKVIKYYADLVKLYYNCEDNSSESEDEIIIRMRCDNFAINVSFAINSIISVNITSTSKYSIKIYRDSLLAEYSDADGNESYSCYGDCTRALMRWVKRAFAPILDGMGRYPPLPQDLDVELLFSTTRNGKGFIHVFVTLSGHRVHLLSIDPWGNIVFYPQLSHFNKYSFILNTAKVLL